MKHYSVNKKTSVLAGAFLLQASLACILCWYYPNHSLGILALLNTAFILFSLYSYRSWFTVSLRKLAVLNKQVLAGKGRGDELQQAVQSIEKLFKENESAIEFIDTIGRGDLNAQVVQISDDTENNALSRALLKMRDQLQEVAAKERERSWVSENLASFTDILRSTSTDLPELCNTILAKLVKALGVNQGGLFVLNDEEEDRHFLELVACYAYDRRKYQQKHVEIGEGLLGQTFLEKESVYMNDIPDGYTHITSGLGERTASCLLIIPIKQNDEVLGMLELAAFRELQPYQIEFVEKISQSVAAVISATKTRRHTKLLLEESQRQTEELRAQEEEMRQNMEELQATQEASMRMQEELRQIELQQREKIEELSQARLIMEEQEAKLKASQEKAQKRSLMFKEKMEILDFEIEGKNAQIKTLTKQLNELKARYNISEETERLSGKASRQVPNNQKPSNYERNRTQVC
jgi:GAF domain-containing protein